MKDGIAFGREREALGGVDYMTFNHDRCVIVVIMPDIRKHERLPIIRILALSNFGTLKINAAQFLIIQHGRC
jgi:hypothetical protein